MINKKVRRVIVKVIVPWKIYLKVVQNSKVTKMFLAVVTVLVICTVETLNHQLNNNIKISKIKINKLKKMQKFSRPRKLPTLSFTAL